AKRAAICQILFTPQFLDSKASLFKAEVLRNYNLLYSISNYSFAPLLFQMDCETEELKKFRSITQPNEDPRLKMSRILRRKAEESYRNSQWDEAIRQFNESDEKNESDYTTHYQLGLIYFFEKADYNEACNSFKKAAKLSQNKSSVIFICSTVFFGLLLRLFAAVTRSQNLLEESYSALTQAYNLDNQNSMANYALAQSCASLAQKSSFATSAKDLIKRLIKTNEFTALQMIYDVAFDAFLPQIEEAVVSLVTEMKNSSIDSFKEIDDSIDRISQMSKYLGNAPKLAAIKNEYRVLQDRINNVNYFEMKDIQHHSKRILEEFQAVFQEVNENRAYYQIREVAEDVIKDYKGEEDSIRAPLLSLEADLKSAVTEFEKLEKTYPPDREEQIIKKKVVIKGKVETVDQKVEASVSWKKQKIYLFIKSLIGCIFAVMVVVAVICLFMFMKVEIKPVSYVMFVIFMLFTPLYGSIGGEVYYLNIEAKRRRLHEKVEKLEKLIEVKKPRVEEDIVKLKEKYAKTLSEKTKLAFNASLQIVEVSLKGNFEQIKRYLANT
ncbi:MAG TPA: hypothetical protein PKL57_07015, partial [Candidatus Wallbacteria bacterium]|nr:hypothetical protein [Candidatus Wallbacteria bacterium]